MATLDNFFPALFPLIPTLNNFELLFQLKCSSRLIWLEVVFIKCKFHEGRDCVCLESSTVPTILLGIFTQ